MTLRPFHHDFPEVAGDETVTVELFDPEDGSSWYAYVEQHCADPDCGCKRVELWVYERSSGEVRAEIEHAWDGRGGQKPKTTLNPEVHQDPMGSELCAVFGEILADGVQERLERHARMMKQEVEADWPNCSTDGAGRPAVGGTYVSGEPDVGRNDPCPCESGRKYKKCCLGRPGGPKPPSFADPAEGLFDDLDWEASPRVLRDVARLLADPSGVQEDYEQMPAEDVVASVDPLGVEVAIPRVELLFEEHDSVRGLVDAWAETAAEPVDERARQLLETAARACWPEWGSGPMPAEELHREIREGYDAERRMAIAEAVSHWTSAWESLEAYRDKHGLSVSETFDRLGVSTDPGGWLADFAHGVARQLGGRGWNRRRVGETLDAILAAVRGNPSEVRHHVELAVAIQRYLYLDDSEANVEAMCRAVEGGEDADDALWAARVLWSREEPDSPRVERAIGLLEAATEWCDDAELPDLRRTIDDLREGRRPPSFVDGSLFAPDPDFDVAAGPVGGADDWDEEVSEDYKNELIRRFLRSPEARGFMEAYPEEGVGFWIDSLLWYVCDYESKAVADVDVRDLESVLFSFFPRKVSDPEADGEVVVAELRAFFGFVARQFDLENAAECERYLDERADSVAEEFEHNMQDRGRWGMAKSFFGGG